MITNRQSSLFHTFPLISLLLSLVLLLSCSGEDKKKIEQQKIAKRPEKAVIIVLDISTSMRSPGSNIFDEVKKSLEKFIHPLQPGDIVQFATFAEDVKIFPEIIIKSEDTKEPILKIISSFEANGQATYTSYMLAKIYDQYKKLKASYPNHYISAIVLSDGYDKPPQGRKRISLKDYIKKDSKETIEDWFVHYIALGVLDERISKDIKAAIPKATVQKIDIQKDPKADNKISEVTEKLDKKIDEDIVAADSSNFWTYFLIFVAILLVILIILLILYLNWRRKKLILKGYLTYWNNERYKDEPRLLSIMDRKSLSIGLGEENDLSIPEFSLKTPVIINPKFMQGKVVPVIDLKKLNKRNFKMHTGNRPYLIQGDIFSVANYSFKYTEN